jgi:glycosyltransferase involved in cell wall biosynthesis
MLAKSLRARPGVIVLNFSWRTALLHRYDVFHVHWPEILVSGHSPAKKAVRQVLTVLLLIKLRLTRTPIVRTVHNVQPPQGITRRETLLLKAIERQTTLRIRLNAATELPPDRPAVTIPHGHYRDWYASYEHRAAVPGQLGYVGLIRRYKGVDTLIRAFQDIGMDQRFTLCVGGNPSTTELASTIRRLAGDDPRIMLKLEFLSDAEFVDIVTSSELIVLPYRFMHNSGGTLAALSLDRPVLLPDNAVNRELSTEVGPGWVIQYSGELTADQLVGAVRDVRAGPDRARPNLGRRDWVRSGEDHVLAYRDAIALLRGRK